MMSSELNKGFTLIELLVVVAIIGVLAAVGVVAFNGFLKSSKINSVKNIHQQCTNQFNIAFTRCNGGMPLNLFKYNGEEYSNLCLIDNNNLAMTGWEFGDNNYVGEHMQFLGFRNPYNSEMMTCDKSNQCSGMSCSHPGVDPGQTVYNIQRDGTKLYILIYSRLTADDNDILSTRINLSCIYEDHMPSCEIY